MKVPDSWRSARLGEVVDVLYGRALPASARTPDGRYPIVGSAGRMPSRTDNPLTTRAVLVVGRKGNVGHVTYEPSGSWPVDTTYYIEPPADILEGRFLFFHLTHLDLKKLNSSTAVPSLRRPDLERQVLAIPPLEEQRRIVDILEDHLSRLDAAGAYLDAAVRRSRAMRQLLVDRATTAGQAGVRPGDRLPPGWAWRSIKDVVGGVPDGSVIGPFGSDLLASDYRSHGTPLVFVRDVRRADFTSDGRRYVDAEKARHLRAHTVQRGDVLITKMGDPPGDAAVYEEDRDAIVTADVIRLRASAEYDPRYLAYAINSSATRKQIAAITRGVAQRKMSLGRFRSGVRLPVPGREHQEGVVCRLTEDLRALDALVMASSTTLQRAQQLRRALLAAAFSGRLTGHALDMDLAEELVS